MKERGPIFYDAERVRWRRTRRVMEVSAVLLTVANSLTGLVPITMTGVTTDQLLVSGGTLVATGLSIS